MRVKRSRGHARLLGEFVDAEAAKSASAKTPTRARQNARPAFLFPFRALRHLISKKS
jgi:hypothetical protein